MKFITIQEAESFLTVNANLLNAMAADQHLLALVEAMVAGWVAAKGQENKAAKDKYCWS